MFLNIYTMYTYTHRGAPWLQMVVTFRCRGSSPVFLDENEMTPRHGDWHWTHSRAGGPRAYPSSFASRISVEREKVQSTEISVKRGGR